jgi:hypothetical protein
VFDRAATEFPVSTPTTAAAIASLTCSLFMD